MCLFNDFIKLLLATSAFVFCSSHLEAQASDCNCNPDIKFLIEDCITQSKDSEIGYYIYSKPIAIASTRKWVKLFEDGKLIIDKEVSFDSKGFYSDVIKIKPTKDSHYHLEFHCDKDRCFTSNYQVLRTVPDFEIQTKDISCYGNRDGETKLIPETMQGIDLVWESGDRKNFVENMHKGLYKVTVENKNGCKVEKEIFVHEPEPLRLEPKFLSFVKEGKTSHCMKVEVLGGLASYRYDWDANGIGLWDDKSHITCSENAKHTVKVMDQNGCVTSKEIAFQVNTPKVWSSNDVSIKAEKEMSDGKFLYNLNVALDQAYGDMDGDGLDGTVFDVEYFRDPSVSLKIDNPKEFLRSSEEKIYAVINTENGSARGIIALESSAIRYCLRISEACDNGSPVELIPVFCTTPITPLPSGGTYRAVNASIGPLNGQDETSRISGPDALGKYYFNPIDGSGNYSILYTVGGVEYIAPFDVQSINPQFFTTELPICGNDKSFTIQGNPKGGTLTGPSGFNLIDFEDIGTNRIFIIDRNGLNINTPYKFYYNYSQTNASGLTCRKIAETDVTILDYPRISINTFDQQKCEKESINLNTTAATTDGSSALTYTWYFTPNGGNATIIGNTPNITVDEVSRTGRYIVEVRQNNQCSNRDSGTVQVFELPKVNSEIVSGVTCFGVSSARVNLSVENVTMYDGYTFTWTGKKTGIIFSGREQSNLPADSFLIRVTTPPLTTSGLQCSLKDTIVIRSLPNIGITCSPRDVTVPCFGEMNITRNVTVAPTATGPFNYSLTSKNGPWQTSSQFTGLGVGNDPSILSKDFKVFVRDGNGCVDSCDFTISQPQRLSCSLNKTDLTCFQNGSGSITATATGGTSPYRYAWSNGVIVPSTSLTTSNISGLSAGNYSLTITDANNCMTTCSITLTQPTPITPLVNPVNVCLDHTSQVFANASGGTSPYTYAWSLINPGTTAATSASLTGTTNDNVQDFDAWCLMPGQATLLLLVTDNNNCTSNIDIPITLRSCFDLALRKRVILPTKQYYPGDTVTFSIEVFNQGTVNATDVKVTDILDSNMQFNLNDNTIAQTGNDNNWEAELDGTMSTTIDKIDAGQKERIKVVLIIKDNISSQSMINYARVTGAYSEVPYGSITRTKINPIDEDDLSTNSLPVGTPEKDDEICDTGNTGNVNGECTLGDDVEDEDKLDYAVVSICQLVGRESDSQQCVTSEARIAGIAINTPQMRDEMDPTGNGDGIVNGDTGNKISSIHNTYLDAMMGTKPITGKIIFSNGNGGANSSNGMITPQGDLRVFANQNLNIFGRLVALDGCVGVSTLTLDLLPQITVTEQPENILAVLGQDDVCFDVIIDNSLGIPFTIQWQEKINNEFVNIDGANSTELCIDLVTEDYDKKQFRVQTFAIDDPSKSCATLSASAILEIEGDPVFVCHDLVNVSLGDNCEALITPDILLQDSRFSSRIIVQITNSEGLIVPNPITSEYVGQLLTVSMIDIISGNSCWGMIMIEDKLPPVITCPTDYIVSCSNSSFNPPIPAFEDACDIGATIEKTSDIISELECGRADGMLAKRTLTYVAKDKWGNKSLPCTFNVYYRSTDLNQVVWPSNVSLSCRIAPSYPTWDSNRNNQPDVNETGIPTIDGLNIADLNSATSSLLSNNLCRINVTYDDEEITLCGNSYKIIRSWKAINWCNSAIISHIQLIEVKDNKGPIVSCPEDNSFEILTDEYTCTANFLVPAPSIQEDCNSTTWTVAYLLADNNGNAPVNGTYITKNVTFDGKNYTITDLPIGRTWLRYSVVDACDNLSYCFTEVDVKDKTKPTPVCEQVNIVGLNEQSTARLYANSIDDGSHDNCSDVRFGIRRVNNSCGISQDALLVANYNGSDYYTFIDFCCSDQTNNVQMVELLVIDESNNMNTCMTTIEVQQKVLPVLTCPSNLVVDCEAITSPQALNSFATFTEACSLHYLDFADTITQGSCNERTIRRTWSVKPKGTNTAIVSCVQTISVENLTPFNLNSVVFPENKTLINQCNSAKDFGPDNPLTGGYPKWNTVGCAQVAYSYQDQIFEDVDDACFKIIRHWSVMDWCTFDLSIPSTLKTYQQVIKVIDTERPTAICSPVVLDIFESCSGNVTIMGEGSDLCTPASQLTYRHSLNGGSFVTGRTFSQNLAVGNHRLRWIVIDKCDNSDTCTQMITVRDAKKPSPYCIGGITTVLMPNTLSVELWAKDYNLGATDNCTGTLRFTFGPNRPLNFTTRHYYKNLNGVSVEAIEAEYLAGDAELWNPSENSSALAFDCDDLGLKELKIYVWDAAGNNDYCTVSIKIQDNSGKCTQPKTIVAQGTITSISGSPMDAIETQLTDALSYESKLVKTNVSGKYLHDQMIDKVPYIISPSKSGDYLNGVSTLDMVMIQRHILGIEPLKDLRLYIAADVNNDGKITAADLSEIRKLILGVTNSFPQSLSWKFLSPQEDQDNPALWPEKVYFEAKTNTTFTNDFVGIKLGDVNMSAQASASDNKTENRNIAQQLSITDLTLQANNESSVAIKAGDLQSISGLQLSFEFSANVSVTNLTSALIDMTNANYRQYTSNGKNILNVSWNSTNSIDLPKDGVLFNMVLKAAQNVKLSEVINISKQGIEGEVIDRDVIAYPIELRFTESTKSEDKFKVYQNTPNPFTENTIIKYYVQNDEKVEIKITDTDGKEIYRTIINAKAGDNEILLNRSTLTDKNGVFLLKLSTAKESKTIKMITTE